VLRPYPVQVLRELSELKPGFYGEVQSVGIPQYGSSLADVAKLMISPLWWFFVMKRGEVPLTAP
jgi:hypothetical protein